MFQTEFNDDEIGPSKANDPLPEPVPEDLDLDGMKEEMDEQEEGKEGAEENGKNSIITLFNICKTKDKKISFFYVTLYIKNMHILATSYYKHFCPTAGFVVLCLIDIV